MATLQPAPNGMAYAFGAFWIVPGNNADGFRDSGLQTLLLGIVLPSPGLHPFFDDSIQESRHRRFFAPGFVLDCGFR
jgi:hypothetical protein